MYTAFVGVNVTGGVVPTLISKVCCVTLVTLFQTLSAGSVALGYVCLEKLSSIAQVKVNESCATCTFSPAVNPWSGIVRVNTPVIGSYEAPVTVCFVKPVSL